jgi:release factor glutamine methyltransferase
LRLHERLAEARGQLRAAGVSDAEAAIDVDFFARTILGWDRARLIVAASDDVPPALEPRFSEWIARCARHEPASYIVGTREFWGLDFEVTPAVLIPRPETELVVEEVLSLAGLVPSAGSDATADTPKLEERPRLDPAWPEPAVPLLRIADIGTGSGCIAVSIAHAAPNVHLVATDISAEAVAVARRNAERHGVARRIDFVATSYLDGVEGDFDVIAANPPYVRLLDRAGLGANVRHEPEVALFGGNNGLLHIEGVLDTAGTRLHPHGWLVMEIGLGQEDAVAALIAARPSLATRAIRHDLQGIARTFVVQKQGH